MKNKKLGKILLCTTLALATPFALAACGNNGDNNKTPEENNEPAVQQPVDNNNQSGNENQNQQQNNNQGEENNQNMQTESYVKTVVWPTEHLEKTTFSNDDAVRAALVDIMYDPRVMSAYEPTMQPGEDGYDEAYTDYQGALAIYRQALTNLINEYIKDTEQGQAVNSEKSHTYTYTVAKEDISNFDEEHTYAAYTGLRAYFEEYYNAYDALYRAETTKWTAIPDSTGIFFTVNDDRTEDVLISFEYNSTAKTITIHEFSFSKNGIQSAYAEIQKNMENEINRLFEAAQQQNG